MVIHSSKKTGSASLCRFVTAAAICMMLLLLAVFSGGCGDNLSGRTPEEAVRRFLSAWEAGDWNSYKAMVVVDGDRPSGGNEDAARQVFDGTKLSFDNLIMKTAADGVASATVVLTEGKITTTVDVLDKPNMSSINLAKVADSQKPQFKVVKVGGTWFVDVGTAPSI